MGNYHQVLKQMGKRQLRRQRWRQRGQQAEPPKTLLSVLLSVDLSAMMAAVDRIVQMTLPAAEALRQVGIAASSPFIRSAVARFDTGALQATPFMQLPRARCISIPLHFYPRCPWPPKHGTPSSFGEVCGDAAVGRIRTACDRCAFYSPPPSCMSNSANNPALTCAIYPLRRPEGRCNDWEDNGTEAAAIARGRAELRAREAYGEAIVRRREAIDAASRRPEAHAYISAAGQVTWHAGRFIGADGRLEERRWPSVRVLTHETVEEDWRWMQLPDGSEERVLLSRTTTRHYADGRREIVPEVPVPPPRLEARTFINGIEQVVCVEDDPEPSPVQLPPQEIRDLYGPNWRRYGWPD